MFDSSWSYSVGIESSTVRPPRVDVSVGACNSSYIAFAHGLSQVIISRSSSAQTLVSLLSIPITSFPPSTHDPSSPPPRALPTAFFVFFIILFPQPTTPTLPPPSHPIPRLPLPSPPAFQISESSHRPPDPRRLPHQHQRTPQATPSYMLTLLDMGKTGQDDMICRLHIRRGLKERMGRWGAALSGQSGRYDV